MGELALIYELYLEYQHQIEALEAAGHTGSTLYADYVAERDRAWNEYHTRGGYLPPLHAGESRVEDSSGELGPPKTRPVLRFGSRGPAVADAQRRLGIEDDGIFGSETRRHTKQFQRNAGLDDDGIIGELTWTALLDPTAHDPTRPEVPASPPDEVIEVCGDETNTIALIDGVLQWGTASAWCGDTAPLLGFFDTAAVSEGVDIEIYSDVSGQTYAAETIRMEGGHLHHPWPVLDVLPHHDGSKYKSSLEVLARVGDVQTSTPLRINFISKLDKAHYRSGHDHFDLSLDNYQLLISSDVKYVKGWAAQVVDLGSAVPPGTRGLLDDDFPWPGHRWMRNNGVVKEYWNGDAWVPLPAGFPLNDSNHFAVGFYESTGTAGAILEWLGADGRSFTSQYGGTWPETFPDWDIRASVHQAKIRQWEDVIRTTWTGKFNIRRTTCTSTDNTCCRYTTRAEVAFVLQDVFGEEVLIVADGNIRSNSALFFLGEARRAMPAHEFGHHLGNPDEYAGAESVDPTLNGDGAVNGIDPNSIMGQNMITVKSRHFRTICAHLSKMVRDQYGKMYTYEAVSP